MLVPDLKDLIIDGLHHANKRTSKKIRAHFKLQSVAFVVFAGTELESSPNYSQCDNGSVGDCISKVSICTSVYTF